MLAHLLVIQGVDQGQRFDLDDREISLGRGVQNQIRIHDTEASRSHARIALASGRYVLTDLNSSNGTFVNGRLVRVHELNPGDEIQTGRTVLRYIQTEEPTLGTDEIAKKIDLREGKEVQSADQIVESAAIHEAELGELAKSDNMAQSLRNLQLLYRIAEEVVRPATTISSLLNRILTLAIETSGADRGCVLLRSVGSAGLRPVAVHSGKQDDPAAKMPVSRSIVDYVLKNRQGVRTSDARSDTRFADSRSIFQSGIREAICVPMQGRYELQGVIYLDITTPAEQIVLQGRAEARFTEDLLRLLVAIGRQAALAVEDNQYQQALVKSERLAAVGQTITILSHNIKNILQGMRGGTYLIDMGLKGQDEEMVRKGWTIVDKNQDRIYRLVLDLLTLSKERQPSLKSGDLNAIVEDACELMQARAQEIGVRFEWRLGEQIPGMLIDNEAIHRVILNIVGNALEAVEGREAPRVTLTTHFERDTGVVGITVTDNGAGIPPHILPALFNIFESTKGTRGTGIGLAVSQKVIREHGGEIYVENLPTGGARFAMEWPLIADERHTSATIVR